MTACTKCFKLINPQDAKLQKMKCECGGRIKKGVDYRISEIADFKKPQSPDFRPPYVHLMPLAELISTVCDKGVTTKTVQSKWQKLIDCFENTTPYDFLKAKYKGGKPTNKDVSLIESLLVDQELNPGVVNVLIDYVLRINDNKLNKNFVEAIASQWKLSNINTVKDAMLQAEKEYKKNGMYFLDSILLNEEKNAITIRGLLSIGDMHNKPDTELTYKLVLTNQLDGSTIEIPMDRWTNSSEYPFDASSIPGYKYDFSGAWFTKTFTFDDIPSGDYTITIEAATTNYYTSKILSNDNMSDFDSFESDSHLEWNKSHGIITLTGSK